MAAHMKGIIREFRKDGKMSADELKSLLMGLNPALNWNGFESIIAPVGRDKDGMVDLFRFIDFVFWTPLERQLGSAAVMLRIIQITDVYILDNFPSLSSMIKAKREEVEPMGGTVISMLTGDFLAPYLLSSLDNGIGMMKMINATPIDFLIWGNHDLNDMRPEDVVAREREFQGIFLNTNMQEHESFKDSKCQRDAAVLKLSSGNGGHRRRVGLLGLNTDEKALYKKDFQITDPWDALRHYKQKLEEEQSVDLVLPLCHFYEKQDEKTCREFDVPVVLSGHDHHCVDRVIDGTRLLKPGSDGHFAIVLDVIWDSPLSSCAPRIEAETVKVTDWPADDDLVQIKKQALMPLERLQHTQIARVEDRYRPLTSNNARGARVSMATYLLSRMRDALNLDCVSPQCDCVCIKGGKIRGGRDYGPDEQITLEVLLSELPEDEIFMCTLPGSVLRIGLRETWTTTNTGWFQYDDKLVVDDDGFVVSVAGNPLDPERLYHVGTFATFYRARDGPTIGTYFEEHPEHKHPPDSGMPCHSVLLKLFAREVWLQAFKYLDKNRDGEIDACELKCIDKDENGMIGKHKMMELVQQAVGFESCDGEYTFVNAIFDVAGDIDRDEQLTIKEMQTAFANTEGFTLGFSASRLDLLDKGF